jgi:hypothetical protein
MDRIENAKRVLAEIEKTLENPLVTANQPKVSDYLDGLEMWSHILSAAIRNAEDGLDEGDDLSVVDAETLLSKYHQETMIHSERTTTIDVMPWEKPGDSSSERDDMHGLRQLFGEIRSDIADMTRTMEQITEKLEQYLVSRDGPSS